MADRALVVPELLERILWFCDAGTLSKCVRVNRAWSSVVIPLLWRGDRSNSTGTDYAFPNVNVLENLVRDSPQRFCRHIAFVKRLSLRNSRDSSIRTSSELWDSKMWSAVRATHVIIHVRYGDIPKYMITSFLHPSLEHFEIPSDSICTKHLLRVIQMCAPNLKSLTIHFDRLLASEFGDRDFDSSDVDPPDLLQFLEQMPHIRNLGISENLIPRADAAVVRHILTRPNLESLSLISYAVDLITEDALPMKSLCKEYQSRSWLGCLSKLEMYVVSDSAIGDLLTQARQLQDINFNSVILDLLSLYENILQPIASGCSRLVSLTMQFDGETDPSEFDFSGFCYGCTMLTHLHIGWDLPEPEILPAEALRLLVRELPSIKDLDLSIRWDMDREMATSEFCLLPQVCPHLEALRLDISIDVFAPVVGDLTPCFKNLRTLTLRDPLPSFTEDTMWSNYLRVARDAEQLEQVRMKRMPKLEGIFAIEELTSIKEELLQYLNKRLPTN